ncbi:hypothetical protein EDB83DRAFT_2552988, partial [Lactarius deliciosus]
MASATTKVALVTGTARGTRRTIALRLAEDDFEPSTSQSMTYQRSRAKCGANSASPRTSLWKERMVWKIVTRARHGKPRRDTLVLTKSQKLPSRASAARWAVNARGTMLCYEHAGKQMIAQGRGRRIIGAHHPISFNFHIDPWLHQGPVRHRENRVNSSSLCVVTGRSSRPNTNTTPNIMSAYSATKFAVRGLTQAAAREFGKHGITANAHSPGVMDTSMIDPLRATDGTSPLPLDAITASTPVRRLARLGTPDNVADPSLVSYLASTLALSLVNVSGCVEVVTLIKYSGETGECGGGFIYISPLDGRGCHYKRNYRAHTTQSCPEYKIIRPFQIYLAGVR